MLDANPFGLASAWLVSGGPAHLFEKTFSDWLFDDRSEQALKTKQLLYQFQPFTGYIDYLYAMRDTQLYLDRYGFTPEDITDFRKLPSTSGLASLRSSVNFVSSNIKRLYG